MFRLKKISIVFALLAMISGADVRADQLQLTPVKDNTLYQKSDSLSNAKGIGVFSGRTGDGSIVRCVMAFDLSAIPPGSIIQEVSLTLRQTNTNNNAPQARTVSLYRVTKDWGEATSQATLGGGGGGGGGPATAGDATWLHTFFNTSFWENPGGDFAPDVSGSIQVAANGDYVWRSAGMTADVQRWVDNRESNFGWLLRGDEDNLSTAKRFGSRESVSPPVLLVQFSPGSSRGRSDRRAGAPRLGRGRLRGNAAPDSRP
ncbi:MAG: DNRLRE domain-containing protein [Acidobacteria bacterium]|nr:MAG: DNRLRE domain-containing protein [Acidobacteriota bacterium]